jgi:diguanylate cyclase (GGDEF)-like protein
VADLLTAFFFLTRFYVSGRLVFGVLAGAYAFTGLLTWGYIATYPHMFSKAEPTPGQMQLPFYFWLIWHCTFPVLVACAALIDSPLKRVLSRRTISALTGVIALGPIAAAACVIALLLRNVDSLPQLIFAGDFQLVNSKPITPTIVVLNGLVAIFLFARKRPVTPLMLWLSVATFSMALEALMMDFSEMRFSYAFDTGKLMTVFTSCVVLVMLLADIARLYERLGEVARVDVLTSLNNRRSFDEYFEVVYHNACRSRRSIALLVIDIDFFKRYNDSYGHLAGDLCLRRVAQTLGECVRQPLDFVARYGGEEFVVLLPDTPPRGVAVVAERIRAHIEGLAMTHCAAPRNFVTVSVGIAYAAEPHAGEQSALFEAADAALYEAKDRGGNVVALSNAKESSAA